MERERDRELDPKDVQTRPASHPDGFSFLLPHDDPFWKTWLAFTSQELERFRFLRWRYKNGQVNEGEVTLQKEETIQPTPTSATRR